MIVDREYCMSSFLMFRTIADHNKAFADGVTPNFAETNFERVLVGDSFELEAVLKKQVEESTRDGKAALALSGGIDSAILARFMPKGSAAYTFKCVVPGIEVTDESPAAARYAEECGLIHKTVEIYWEDFEKYAPLLMKHKGAPIHSIEVQIYKASLQVKADGFSKLIFGENADIIYGGMDGLLAKNWLFGEFVDRYTYVFPYKVLKSADLITAPYFEFETEGYLDAYEFINNVFRTEALGTYHNACETASIKFVGPYSNTRLSGSLDYDRIRTGDTKYIVREIFRRLYPNFITPPKIPMPRPMNEWLKNWKGPTRPEFLPHCTDHMTGDQKWLVYCLELFLNLLDNWAQNGDED